MNTCLPQSINFIIILKKSSLILNHLVLIIFFFEIYIVALFLVKAYEG